MTLRPQFPSRIALWGFAALLVVQAAWLLAVALVRPQLAYFPTDRSSALAAQDKRVPAGLAARVGAVRGELWVDDALALAAGPVSQIFGGPANPANDEAGAGVLEQAQSAALRAARWSPHDSRAWLLLASLAQRRGQPDRDVATDLKMSYYTGPDEAALLPLRLRIATRANTSGDDELQDLVVQDLTAVVLHRPALKPDVAAAYGQASPAGKQLIETTLAKLDAALLATVRGVESVK